MKQITIISLLLLAIGINASRTSPQSFLAASVGSSVEAPQVSLTSFSIKAAPNADAVMKFTDGAGHEALLSLLSETGSFVFRNDRYNIIEILQNGNIELGISKLQLKSLEFTGDLYYKNQPQWKLFVNENYWTQPVGWDFNQITTCGGVNLLGGYKILSRGNNTKVFKDLPVHKMVRITATFHFIDGWLGEAAYLMANIGNQGRDEYLWTDLYDSHATGNKINVCGNAEVGEGKFSVPIDVVFAHAQDTIKLTFGSKSDQNPDVESWGISNLSIHLI